MFEVSYDYIKGMIPKRKITASKRDNGRVFIIGGSITYMGAPFFAAQAAVNTGCGLCYLAAPRSVVPVLGTKLNEPIFLPFSEDEQGQISPLSFQEISSRLAACEVCLLGPGLGRSEGIAAVVHNVIRESKVPVILDADALWAIAGFDEIITNQSVPIILTPHEGEFSRICPKFRGEQREKVASDFAVKTNCTVVLKGHHTITALPDGKTFCNLSGNSGMAKGGSGDVLAGVIAALIAQGIEPDKAAYIGVWIHGRAGDLARDEFGTCGMTPTDLLLYLKYALKEFE